MWGTPERPHSVTRRQLSVLKEFALESMKIAVLGCWCQSGPYSSPIGSTLAGQGVVCKAGGVMLFCGGLGCLACSADWPLRPVCGGLACGVFWLLGPVCGVMVGGTRSVSLCSITFLI